MGKTITSAYSLWLSLVVMLVALHLPASASRPAGLEQWTRLKGISSICVRVSTWPNLDSEEKVAFGEVLERELRDRMWGHELPVIQGTECDVTLSVSFGWESYGFGTRGDYEVTVAILETAFLLRDRLQIPFVESWAQSRRGHVSRRNRYQRVGRQARELIDMFAEDFQRAN